MAYERQLALVNLAEAIKYFKGYTIQSTISNSAQNYNDEQADAINDTMELVHARSDPKIDPSSNPNVAEYTTDRNSPKIYIVDPVRPQDHWPE